MKYNVKWIIDGEIINNASSKEEAEKNIKVKLESLISNNKKDFDQLQPVHHLPRSQMCVSEEHPGVFVT